MAKKTILFLSGLDFKDKSIQVIKNTPEKYVEKGWNVHYIVARDNSKSGNYFYEKEINPKGIDIIRFNYPFTNLYDKFNIKYLDSFFRKLRILIVVLSLFFKSRKIIKKENVDIVYGYEYIGVLAANLVKIYYFTDKFKIVSRFQGTFFYKYFKERKFKSIIKNLDHLLALYLPSDLCIMTNDGTQGDKALEYINSKNLKNFKFWVNGVDDLKINKDKKYNFRKKLGISNDKFVFLTVSRLVRWKRVDRVVEIVNYLINEMNFNECILYIVGDGNEMSYLKNLVNEYNLHNYIKFIGSVEHKKVKKYMNTADIFFSFYEGSNVGNPLLEAIRCNKIIFTLDNGDTKNWINHYKNGFIYNPESEFIKKVSYDLVKLYNNKELLLKIKRNIKKTENDKLWSWDERLNAETREVEKLIA